MAQSYEIWKALGIQIRKSLQTHTGISVPPLGQFGFINPDTPIFIPNASFALKPCTFEDGLLKPFTGSLSTPSTLSLPKLASYIKTSTDAAKEILDTAISEFKDRAKSDCKQEIPRVGTIRVKSGTITMSFFDFSQSLTVTEDAAKWLESNLGICVKSRPKSSSTRPQSSTRRPETRSVSSSSRKFFAARPASAQPNARGSQRPTTPDSSELIEAVAENMSKLVLICQAKDQTGRGLISFSEFLSLVAEIYPNITEDQLKALIARTNSSAGGRIRYKLLLSGLNKGKNSKEGSQVSDLTDNYSRITLAPLAKLIWDKKLVITELSQASGMRPRLELQPSELLSLLKKSGVFINIHQLKALAREGEGLSVLSLIKTAKKIAAGDENSADTSRPVSALMIDSSFDRIRAFFAHSNLSQVFQALSREGYLTAESFKTYLSEQSGGKFKQLEAHQAFMKVSKDSDQLNEYDFCKGFCRHENPKLIQIRGFKALRTWLRQERLSTEQGFEYLLTLSKSIQNISFEAWIKLMKNFEFNLYESSVIFDAIDTKQDKMIDACEWMNKVYEEEGMLQSFKDTILKYGISKEDLLIKLNASTKQRLAIEEMADALRRMDPTLTAGNAVNMAIAAAGSKGYIDVQDFLSQLSQPPEEFHGDWNQQILSKIQRKIKGDINTLKKLLENADSANSGVLELVKFQECVSQADLGLESIEIERLGRVLDRKGNLTVDYNEFLRNLETNQMSLKDPLKSTALRLQVFLSQNGLSPGQLLKKLGGRVEVASFERFLAKKVQKTFNEAILKEVAERFDVDKDGLIGLNDLESVLNSRNYITLNSDSIHPTGALSPTRARPIIKDIRSALIQSKVSYYDAFNEIDSEGLGVLSAKQFSDGLSKYIDLSEPIKLSLFALIDKLGTGLITYDSFCAVLKDNNLQPKPSTDSWTWESDTINRLRQWIKSESLSVENAFRAFDVDFDGIISKEDLRISLMKILKFSHRELISSKIDRLYQLMDSFKRNSIQLSDFKLLFEENSSPEWKESAKQQIGIYISRSFPNVKLSFEAVSELTGKIKLDQFIKWIKSNQILKGFNLTQQLLERLFADLDPHRKAFISESDWVSAFMKFSYDSQCLKEIKDAIRSNFSNMRLAFEFFTSFNKSPSPNLSLPEFQQGISALIPQRFSPSEIQVFWKSLWPNSAIGFLQFSQEFSGIKFISSFSQSSKRSLSHNSTPNSFLSMGSAGSQDPLKRLQSLIKASPKSLEEIFKGIDTDYSGKLSAVEFRKALRKLGLGLSARDIDLVLARIDSNNDGQIDWLEFQKAFKPNETERCVNATAQLRIQKMRSNMSAYMLSPKDAFLQFDPHRIGSLDFSRFTALVNKLSQLSNEPTPAFTVIKDLFEIIDIRKDGAIDMREWLNTFKGETKGVEDSKEFDDVCNIISRNRKLLQITFDAMSKNGRVEVQKVKDVLIGVARQLKVSDEIWNRVVGIAIRQGGVDYRLMLEIYKDRALKKQWHPLPI